MTKRKIKQKEKKEKLLFRTFVPQKVRNQMRKRMRGEKTTRKTRLIYPRKCQRMPFSFHLDGLVNGQPHFTRVVTLSGRAFSNSEETEIGN